MRTTNYSNCFIPVAPDCPATEGLVSPRDGTIGAMQHDLLIANPYRFTSDDLLFEVHVARKGIHG